MQYLIDFESAFIEATDEGEALRKAIDMIKHGDISIDRIELWEPQGETNEE